MGWKWLGEVERREDGGGGRRQKGGEKRWEVGLTGWMTRGDQGVERVDDEEPWGGCGESAGGATLNDMSDSRRRDKGFIGDEDDGSFRSLEGG